MTFPARKRIWIETPGGGERACPPEELAVRYQPGTPFRVESWQSRVDRLISEAERRGEFDNLLGAGRPLDLSDNPYGQELASAHRLMKNAGVAPPWVERDKEVRARREALDRYLEQTVHIVNAMQAEQAELAQNDASRVALHGARPAAPMVPAEPHRAVEGCADRGDRAAGLLRRLRGALLQRGAVHRRGTGEGAAPERGTARRRGGAAPLGDAWSFREDARGAYLKMAEELDRAIESYNAALPRSLGWLEKPRLPAAAAAVTFDARCPLASERDAPADRRSGH